MCLSVCVRVSHVAFLINHVSLSPNTLELGSPRSFHLCVLSSPIQTWFYFAAADGCWGLTCEKSSCFTAYIEYMSEYQLKIRHEQQTNDADRQQ